MVASGVPRNQPPKRLPKILYVECGSLLPPFAARARPGVLQDVRSKDTEAYPSACRRSSIRSAASSSPIETRTVPG